MFAQRERSVPPAVWVCLLALYLIATRWPLAPTHLYYFDSANFALALERFNPALHQPQPPGYPLFVAFTRLIHLVVRRPEQVFVVAGLIAACVAVLLIWALAGRMFGKSAGVFSAALLASNPVFWFGGLTNQIRLFLAVSALGVSLFAWRALKRPDRPALLWTAFAAIGLAAGFRPVIGGLIAPVVLWVWWRNGRHAGDLALGLGALAAVALPWLVFTAQVVGGPVEYLRILQDYTTEQFHGTSALFGATPLSAGRMLLSALVWNLLGVIAWIWAAPFLGKPRFDACARERIIFLALAGAPAFLFSGLVHIGDPDQALASISILCVAGGAVLGAFCGRHRSFRATLATLLIVQTALFFFPPTRLAKAASYRAVAAVDRMTNSALDSIESLRRDGPLTIVHYGSSVASRQLEYYFPDDYVVVLPPGGGEPSIYSGHRAVRAPAGVACLRPGARRVVCLLSWNSNGAELPGWKRLGAVYYYDADPSASVRVGPFSLIRFIP